MSDIPSNWQWSTIGEVSAYIKRGKSPKYIDKSDLPVINQKCIRWEELQLQHLKYIHPEQFSAWDEARFIKPGDVLWNSTGTGTVGRAYHVKEADCTPPKVVDSHVTIVRAAPELDARYLFNWIKGPEVQNKIEEMCDGTTNQIELSRTAIAATAIPIAPREEQTRIANQLDTLLTRIQSCNNRFDAIPALLKRFRQAVLDAATTGALTQDCQGASNETQYAGWVREKALHALPPGWRWARFSEFLTGFRSGTSAVPGTDASAYPVLRSSSVRPLEIDYEDVRYLPNLTKVRAGDLLAEGDLLFTRLSGSIEYVANCAVVRGLGDRNIYYPDRLFRARLIRPEQGTYFELCFASPLLRKHLTVEAKSTAGHQRISMGAVTDFPIPKPPEEQQVEIVRRVEALFALADRIEARATAASAQAQRLSALTLAKAFRGELVAQDPQDEPASMLLQRIAAAKPAKVAVPRGRPRAKQKDDPLTPLVLPPDWAALPDGLWAAPDDMDAHAMAALLVAVLRVWGGPMPQEQARLALALCQHPRLVTVALPADQAAQWRRLVGPTAEPLPTQVARLQPATSSQWRKAITSLRARGDLLEVGSGPQATWALGAGAAHIETAGWPQGRAEWVVTYLRSHGVESILPLLEPNTVEFVHARAA